MLMLMMNERAHRCVFELFDTFGASTVRKLPIQMATQTNKQTTNELSRASIETRAYNASEIQKEDTKKLYSTLTRGICSCRLAPMARARERSDMALVDRTQRLESRLDVLDERQQQSGVGIAVGHQAHGCSNANCICSLVSERATAKKPTTQEHTTTRQARACVYPY